MARFFAINVTFSKLVQITLSDTEQNEISNQINQLIFELQDL